MIAALLPGLLAIAKELIGKAIPDPVERAKAEQQIMEAAAKGELQQVEAQLRAIVVEAQSTDPWTSRARPSFMYVVYLMILASIPMGIVHAVSPTLAVSIAAGMEAWLSAIPEEMWWLFGVGYLGYTGARSWDKRTIFNK